MTPLVVPRDYPTPSGLPPTRVTGVSEQGWFEYDAKQRGKNPFAEMARYASVVVVGTIRQLDPPVFLARPANRWLQPQSVLSPAVLKVEHAYRGDPPANLRVVCAGACSTATDCMPDVVPYRWTDLIGYHLLMFLNGPLSDPKCAGCVAPFKVFVVFPESDLAVDISYSWHTTYKLSDVLTQMTPGLTQTP